MATRIRYGKPNDGTITSTQFYVTNEGARYQVKIKVDTDKTKLFPWKVLEDITEKVCGEGVAVNLHQAKIKAKQKLEQLGISFEKEVREEKPDVLAEDSTNT